MPLTDKQRNELHVLLTEFHSNPVTGIAESAGPILQYVEKLLVCARRSGTGSPAVTTGIIPAKKPQPPPGRYNWMYKPFGR